MATTPTNKPIPSEDPRDLKFNAGKIDEEVNGSADYYTDRFSVQRLTNTGRNNHFQSQMTQQADDWLEQFNQQNSDFQQFLLNSGYQFLGDYENGPYTITARNQIIRYQNEFWRLNAATNPEYTTTGVNSTSWTTDVTHLVSVGDANLRQNLSSSNPELGGSLVNIDNATVSELAENSIFRKMTRADINTMKNTLGAEVDVEYALQALQDEGHTSIVFPHDVKGIYTLAGNVTVTATLIAYTPCVKPYTISGDSSFLNKGAVIRKAAGADYIFGPGTVPRFYGLLLDGRDKSRPLFNQLNQPRGGILFNCGVYRFLYGIGSYSYTSIQVGKSSICANTIGIRNLIDSRVIDVTINTQSSHAVDLQAGANNNLFQNVRNEWNDGIGYNISGSVGNIITGELVDRNGSANFAITNGGGAIVGNLFSQRPGRNSAAGSTYNSHFYIEGANSYLMVSNVKTRTGVDDDGGGNLTPERVITMGGGSTDFTVQFDNCDLTGGTISPIRYVTTPDKQLFSNNIGVSDLKTTGVYQLSLGRRSVGGISNNQVLSSGVGSTLAISKTGDALADPTTSQPTIPIRRTLIIESRTSSGVASDFRLPFRISRETANASITPITSQGLSSPTGVWATTGATGVNVTLSVSPDGSTVTATLTSVDGVGRFIRLSIDPS